MPTNRRSLHRPTAGAWPATVLAAVLLVAAVVVVPAAPAAAAPATVSCRAPEFGDLDGHCSFVHAAYADFLGAAPGTVDAYYWVMALSEGVAREELLAGLSWSDAWVGAIVDRMYRDTLGRDGEPAGRAYWIGQLRTGARTVADVAALFYASDEYFVRSGGTNAAWVADLYAALLRRGVDASGAAYWARRAAAGRVAVAADFYQSVESRTVRVTHLYATLLGRAPERGGAEYWREQVLRHGDLALAVSLAASPEYRARAVARFPGAAPVAPPPSEPPVVPPVVATWEVDMLAAVNARRAAVGLAPVAACASLTRAAAGYAPVVAAMGRLSHTGPDGSTLSSRAEAAGYVGWGLVAENLAAGHIDVAEVIDGWMGSPGHRANILRADATHAGFGLAYGGFTGTTRYWVQMFGKNGSCR